MEKALWLALVIAQPVGAAAQPASTPAAESTQPHSSVSVLVEPQLWENATEEGKAKLKSVADPSLSPEWPVSISIPEWTTYTKDQIIACKGPGE